MAWTDPSHSAVALAETQDYLKKCHRGRQQPQEAVDPAESFSDSVAVCVSAYGSTLTAATLRQGIMDACEEADFEISEVEATVCVISSCGTTAGPLPKSFNFSNTFEAVAKALAFTRWPISDIARPVGDFMPRDVSDFMLMDNAALRAMCERLLRYPWELQCYSMTASTFSTLLGQIVTEVEKKGFAPSESTKGRARNSMAYAASVDQTQRLDRTYAVIDIFVVHQFAHLLSNEELFLLATDGHRRPSVFHQALISFNSAEMTSGLKLREILRQAKSVGKCWSGVEDNEISQKW